MIQPMKLPMKLLRIVGLCLTAMFVVSMLASATASAVKLEMCASGSPAGTKYETSGCAKALSTGTFAWEEIAKTEAAKTAGTLRLADSKTLAGESAVECFGTSEGYAAGKVSVTTVVNVTPSQCSPVKVCENVEAVSAVHLPWKSELFETEGKAEQKILADGGGEPGWSVTCKAPILGSITDVCTTEEASKSEVLEAANRITKGELLVLLTFTKTHTAKCTQGGAESGKVSGSIGSLLISTVAIRVH
jgi:hypothetical protein